MTYRVFLSSTSRDLAEYREAVHRAIDGLPGFQLVKMEDFGARDASAKDLCTRLVRDCDLFVGLMGHYYGSCPPNEPVSFTELEYRTATAANLPRLMFVAPDDFAIPASLRESDASFERQQAFRREVMTNLVVGSFDTPEKLASAATKALFVWHEERRRAKEAATGAAGEAPKQGPAKPRAEAALGPNPYRGLEAFRRADADRFFGREALVDQLWDTFLELHATRADGEAPVRLLAILGASGSGKSSVAQAGLLAELEKRPLPGRPSPLDVVFTPEARPLEALAVALARQATSEPSPAKKAIELEEVLRERDGHDGLRYLAERMLDAGGAGLILLVDQFEELYSLCADERERTAFIGNLLNAAREPRGRVSIILTLRSDFMGAVNQHPELSRLLARQNVVIPVMGEDELRRVIEEPAKRAGRVIDPATVQLLLEQTRGREGALPLLEFALTRIWDGFTKGVAAAETVHALGGVGGALASQAQAVYDSLGAHDREIARRVFLAMIRLGEGTRDTRRRAPLGEMVTADRPEDRVIALLRRFSEPGCRLISLSGTDATTTAEVAHEALFDHWGLLQNWLDDSREDIRFQRRLAGAASHWDQMGRPDGSLWRPPELDLLREFRARAAADMTPLEVAFADASDRQEARRRWVRRGGIAAAIGGLLLIAGGLTVYSQQQAEFAQRQAELRAEADEAKARADAQRDHAVATQSLFLAELSERETESGNATNGVLLALEALPKDLGELDRPYVVEAEAALYRAVLEHREQAVLGGHEGPVTAATFAPDGTKVVTASKDGTVRLWDATSGKALAALQVPDHEAMSVAFSPNGVMAMTVSRDGAARLWDVTMGQPLATFKDHAGEISAVALSPDGAAAVTASWDGTARLWDGASGRELAVLQGHEGPVWSAVFSPDGARVVTASDDGTARVWDAASGQALAVLQGHEGVLPFGGLWSAAFSPDGAKVVTAAKDGTAQLWDVASGQPLAVLQGHKDMLVRVASAAFSPDGTKVMTASDDRTARLWDAVSGKELAVLQGHDRPVRSAAFSPDGTRVVTASEDGTARLWNMAGSPLVAVLAGHQDSIRAASFDPSGRLILTAGHDLTARLWDAVDGRQLAVLRGHADGIRSATFDPQGTRAATASDDGTMRIWEVPSGRELAVLKGKDGEKFRSAAFSPDGKSVVAATSTGVAQLWDLDSGELIQTFAGHEDSVRSADISSDGLLIVTASYDRTARVWDSRTGEEVARLEGHERELNWAAFSADGSQVVTAAEDGMVRVWDLASGETIARLSGHQGTVRSARFSPDGRRVVTASTDQTARLWDAASGQELAVLRGHERPVVAAGFSPDGTSVVTASTDDTARVWRVFRTTQELIDYARSILPRQLTPEQRKAFFLAAE